MRVKDEVRSLVTISHLNLFDAAAWPCSAAWT